MNYILWNDFRSVLHRDEAIAHTVRHFAFLIENTIIWYDDFVDPYNSIIADPSLRFESTMVDVDGEQKEAIVFITDTESITVLCPEMLTAMFLSDPTIIERFVEEDKDGQVPTYGWKFDPNKTTFSRFYTDTEEDGVPVRVWGNGEKEYL